MALTPSPKPAKPAAKPAKTPTRATAPRQPAEGFAGAYGTDGSSRIRIPKTAEIVAGRIRKDIVTRTLLPGALLPREAEMIASFAVARSTIREAVRILETEGLVGAERGGLGGFRVLEPANDLVARSTGLALQWRNATLGDVYKARAMLEPSAARCAAETRGPEAAARLRAHIQYELEVDHDARLRTDAVAGFHLILLEECGNVTFSILGHALQTIVVRHLALAYRADPASTVRDGPPSERRGYQSHERLADLVAAGDGPGAEAHWAQHMQFTSDYWLRRLAAKSVIEVLD